MKNKLLILSKIIKNARKKEHLTQVQLADALHLSESYIKDLERGRGTSPSVNTLMDLIELLNIDVTPFFYPVPVNSSSYDELLRKLTQLTDSDYKILLATANALQEQRQDTKGLQEMD